MKRIHAFVSGRVQGVFFRAHAMCRAKDLGLTGWIQNTNDDRVETVAEGNRKAVDEFVKFLWKGSPEAEVEDVEVIEEEYKGEFDTFVINHGTH
jgi:acylphosphatase